MFENRGIFCIFISSKKLNKLLSEREITRIIEENERLKTLVEEKEVSLSKNTEEIQQQALEIEQKDERIAWLERMS